VNAPPIRLPSGVRDFLPRAAARRRSLAGRVMDVFEAWGYARIITPVFEVADVLERGLGDGARTAAIRFVEPGTGEIVALRPDITPQIARVVATRLAEVEGPIRLCYEGAVTRLAGERGQREILQAGIELIEAGEPAGDAEVLAVAAAALAAAQLPETRLDVGHVAPARYVLGAAPDVDARAKIAAAIARKDRAGLRRAASVLPSEIAQLAESLIGLWGPAVPTLARAIALPWPDDVRAALDGLGATLAVFSELADQPVAAVTVDLGDVRGFDYYTGVRFAGYAGGAPEAVLRGGRYDELIARYGRAARATGFAIDLEALALAQRALGIALPTSSVGVAVFGPGAAALARTLRSHGIRAATAATAPTASWLRGAGFDVALLLDQNQVLRADDARRPLDTTDTRALVKLLEEDRCLS
jgi:ATP phosphoribosyltransferase regulatory subunit